MTDRREFLKLFGVGAAIVPIIGQTPILEATSTLIEVPKVELVKEGDKVKIGGSRIFGGPVGMSVTFEDYLKAQRFTLQCKTFVINVEMEMFVKNKRATWAMNGIFVPEYKDGQETIYNLITESL